MFLKNQNKVWSKEEIKKAIDLVKGNTPTRIIGLKLGRSESGIRSKMSELGKSLKPTNQSPYNRRKLSI